ncbi:MAG: hypothetical protein JRM99_07015, partial [Nitrososphaerota archaeon]|nr:hypothetical protein [Nitrososphaerota archaeon]
MQNEERDMGVLNTIGNDAKALARMVELRRNRQEDQEKAEDTLELKDLPLGDPALNQKFGFRTPAIYYYPIRSEYQEQPYLKSFMKFARNADAENRVFTEYKVRRLWAGVYMNNSLEECVECLNILKRQIERGVTMGGEKFLQHATRYGWSFAAPSDDTINEFTC